LSHISVVGSLSDATVQGTAAMPSWPTARDRNQSGLPRHISSGFFTID
jgi:hypothetical protein